MSWVHTVYVKTVEKNGNLLSRFSLGCTSFQKKMRFSKIANLLNAPAIHNQKIIVRTFQIPPAVVAHRTHTEPLPRQGLFYPQPTEAPRARQRLFSTKKNSLSYFPRLLFLLVFGFKFGFPGLEKHVFGP